MKKRILVVFLMGVFFTASSVYAGEKTVGESATAAGQGVSNTAKEVGSDIKKGSQQFGKDVKEGDPAIRQGCIGHGQGSGARFQERRGGSGKGF